MEGKKAKVREEFLFWARQYWEHRNPADLLAVGEYWGRLCVLYADAVPEDLEEIMDRIVESLGGMMPPLLEKNEGMDCKALEKKAAYLAMWVQGLYEEQDSYPGEPMTPEGAKKMLETISNHPEEFLTPPEGITPEQLAEEWNKAHGRALLAARERK